MRIKILTLFPEMFMPVLGASITGRAIDNGILAIEPINIRDYTLNKHHRCDDYPYGGGAGMVMTPQPVFDCMRAAMKDFPARRILLSPRGAVLTQQRAKERIAAAGEVEEIGDALAREAVQADQAIEQPGAEKGKRQGKNCEHAHGLRREAPARTERAGPKKTNQDSPRDREAVGVDPDCRNIDHVSLLLGTCRAHSAITTHSAIMAA